MVVTQASPPGFPRSSNRRERWLLVGLVVGLLVVLVPLAVQLWALMDAFQAVGGPAQPEQKAPALANSVALAMELGRLRQYTTLPALVCTVVFAWLLLRSRRARQVQRGSGEEG